MTSLKQISPVLSASQTFVQFFGIWYAFKNMLFLYFLSSFLNQVLNLLFLNALFRFLKIFFKKLHPLLSWVIYYVVKTFCELNKGFFLQNRSYLC